MAVEVAERFVDGKATVKELKFAEGNAHAARTPVGRGVGLTEREAGIQADAAFLAACAAGTNPSSPDVSEVASQIPEEEGDEQAELAAHADLLREIYGNPFRRIQIDPAWLAWKDGAALKVAQAVYDARQFEDLPVLAGLLEQAGCTDREILNHCRSDAVHVKGCWALDLLLGKR